MLRKLAALGLLLLSGLVVLISVIVILIQNSVGAPQPDGVAEQVPVEVGGQVRLAADTGYEVGLVPDREHPDYSGGVRLGYPGCEVTDPAGQPVPLLDEAEDPPLNPFTRYGRFVSKAAGSYRVACSDVSPVPGALIVQTDVWETERALAGERRTRNIVTGLVGAVVFVGLNVLAVWLAGTGRRNRPPR